MGIERFFRSIEENNITNLQSSFTKTLRKQILTQFMYIDFNSIIHITSFKVISELNYLLYKIISNKFENNRKSKSIIKSYNLTLDNDIDHEKYHNIFTEEVLNELIIDKVIEYVYNILTNYIVSNELKFFYIAIDGVPSKAKMIEQKNRRYMGGLINHFQKKIFVKYEDSLKQNKARYLYEKFKISWTKSYITPGTVFMDLLDNTLNSTEFESGIKNICQNLETYVYSGPYEPGEGEKKIVDHLRSLDQIKSNYLIYSPDSDVSLLGLILNCKFNDYDERKVSELKILRHNQQKNSYDIINIDKLKNNLFIYVQNGVKSNLDIDHVINDIVFILTIFGNDFVPKLESLTVRYDFDRIINKYIEVLNSNKVKYLIYYDKNSKRKNINYDVFLDIVKYFKMDEGGNLHKVYMSNNYTNYNKLKKVLDATQENFTKVLNEFLFKLRKFNNDVRKNVNVDKWKSESDFISKLNKLVKLSIKDSFIESYIEYYKKNHKLPRVGITFRKYSKTVENKFHSIKLEKTLDSIDPNLPITEYDKEFYKFNNMLDHYVKKFRAHTLNLGYITVDHHTYTFKSEKIEKGVQRYYKNFFNIENINIKNPQLQNVIKEYLDGLIWVFNYYFNDFDINQNRLYVNTWYYKYTHAPLLTQIYHYLRYMNNQNIINETFSRLKKNIVKMVDFFNCLEHLMYVSPIPVMPYLAPKEYKDFDIYPNIKSIYNNIWNDEQSDKMDCRGALFLNKCHLKINFDVDDKKFISELRKIPLSYESKKRTGNFNESQSNVKFYKYKKLTSLDRIRVNGKNEYHNDDKNIIEQKYRKFKKKYLISGNYDDKIIYKWWKYLSLH